MRRLLSIILVIVYCAQFGFVHLAAQEPMRYTSGEIYEAIQRLRVLGTALYVAAHPDDENTRLISHLTNDLKVHTTYLSMTRGDGGQNLIGPQIGELLGVIRTQELLQARRTDHGEQRFTRANDFGYTKSPQEALAIWNGDEILSDVVWAIRNVQPDIIINRFMAQSSPGNHGHHTASAMLSTQAFEEAGDPTIFPEQMKYVSTWQPKRLFFNTSWWFYGSREKFAEADKSKMSIVDVGVYDPITGWSNSEIAAKSRSMHKSQGFGSTGSRGSEMEYLELLKGSEPKDRNDLFDGIDITWNRVQGGGQIDAMLERIQVAFDFENPHLSVKPLLAVRSAILNLGASIWKVRKLREIDNVIAQTLGLFLEADATSYHAVAGDSVSISLEAVMRSDVPAKLLKAEFLPSGDDLHWDGELANNTRLLTTRQVLIPADQPISTAYWLQEPGTDGMYSVKDQLLRGLPEKPASVTVRFTLQLYDEAVSFTVPVIYKETDPVKGEVYRPFDIVPPVFVNIQSPVYIFNSDAGKNVKVTVKSARDTFAGVLRLAVPPEWSVTPSEIDITFDKVGDEQHFQFNVSPTSLAKDGILHASVSSDGRVWDQMLTEVTFDHIPAQTVLKKSVAKAVHVHLQSEGQLIAYVPGAGDEVASSLKRAGYSVEIVPVEDITSSEMLHRYDVVILGIRAYNTLDRLKFAQGYLFDYVNEGGTLITQYNTSRGLVTDKLAPFPLKIGRDRVTDEQSDVVFLNPEHPVMNIPNKLSQADFEGWVQERGLYFADSWDPAFEPLLSMSDPGEEPLSGALLVAKYGKGYFVYTGLSFFRELPDGVPGAFRLFANLISLSQKGRS